MRSIIHIDGSPEIVISKGELDKLRGLWSILEEISHRGRNGALIGSTPYSPEMLLAMAEDVRGLLIAADNGKSATESATENNQDSLVPEQIQ